MAIINFGGTKEKVITRKEFPMAKARKVLKNETIAIIGYGVQGPAQALNLRDNGFNVIIGNRPGGKGWNRAKADGWKPGKTLFDIEEAVQKGTVIQMLVSDAAQRQIWPVVKKNLKPGAALYFSHGFSIAYKTQTGVIPPKNVDVIMVAPKGSGLNVRRNFLTGAGINSSFAVGQDYTGRATERCLALGIGVGSGYLFPTTFQHEVFSDLTGERGDVDGRAGRRHGGAIRSAPRPRPFSQRSVQRNRRGTHPEPHPAGGRERHGLDVFQLFRHRPARRAGLETQVQEGDAARVQGFVSARQGRQANAPACFPPAAARITRSCCRRNWTSSTTPRCGVPARLSAPCVRRNLAAPSPKAPKALPDVR